MAAADEGSGQESRRKRKDGSIIRALFILLVYMSMCVCVRARVRGTRARALCLQGYALVTQRARAVADRGKSVTRARC